ncbi:replicative DNA helicase [Bradyrhizobium sp. WSM1743]|uniref:replicative DNA helicase n=1 Tax=Bradyrhizobium sp. WSM1743 TaxID=318996 RepID=UPI0006856722|nr:replicative DNA helicase [Bradyrhizobium sp. WSM1743]
MNAPARIGTMPAPIVSDGHQRAAIEVEQALLGAILCHPEGLGFAERHVMADDFIEATHRELFARFLQAREQGRAINHQLARAFLADFGEAPLVDGMNVNQYVARLYAEATGLLNVADFARTVREMADQRRLAAISEQIADDVRRGADVRAATLDAIDALDAVAAQSDGAAVRQVSLREANQISLERMQFAIQNPGLLPGLSWGLKSLDEKTGGLKAGELLVLAGRPGMGKTALGVCIARNVARAGDPVFFSSLEMGAVSLSDRSLADGAYQRCRPIPYYAIANGALSSQEAERVIEAARVQRDWPLKIDPAPGLTISQIAGRARRYSQALARQGKRLGLIVVDHLHIAKPSNRYAGARVNEVGEISAALKALAKELDVPVLALAQLSRKVEERDDKRPNMADLRDSGSIEQDADAIIFVYREAYYLERETAATAEKEAARIDRLIDVKHDLETIIAKQRNGPTGTVKLFCDIGCNAVRDLEGL